MKKVKHESNMRKVVSVATKELSFEEKEKILNWAKKSLVVIENKQLTKIEKLKALKKIKTSRVVTIFVLTLIRLIKNKTWTNQTWARRFGFAGITLGTMIFGSQAAGVATMGSGVGVSLALISTVGATFVGVLIDELSKEAKK